MELSIADKSVSTEWLYRTGSMLVFDHVDLFIGELPDA